VSVKENISEGPEGIILESLLEGIAEYYSAELSVKIQRGQTENALKCKANSVPPLGYKVNAERYMNPIKDCPRLTPAFCRNPSSVPPRVPPARFVGTYLSCDKRLVSGVDNL